VTPTESTTIKSGRGKWMALTAALLGWMFDGLEMGLFPLVARPALQDLLPQASEADIGKWIGVMTAGFLVGAATGGVLFGWLGDKMGRVRAMALSVLTYAVFSGLCGVAGSAEEVFLYRFIASLGMGGEWSLGVSLVMEIWPDTSRGWLAGLIGAASNVGFVSIAVASMILDQIIVSLDSGLRSIGLSDQWVDSLVAHDGWRLLMIFGAFPALLTFFIRLLVPESEKWQEEHAKGSTSHWATRDLLGVLLGSLGPIAMIAVMAWEPAADAGLSSTVVWAIRGVVFVVGLGIALIGYMYPVRRYIARAAASRSEAAAGPSPIARMYLGAALSGVALMGTWASLQWAAPWADQLAEKQALADPDAPKVNAKAHTQIAAGVGAIVGTIAAAVVGSWMSRRVMYCLLCASALGSSLLFFQGNDSYGWMFIGTVFLAGGLTASFYGWLPLYLPELFPTRVRATGQGFAFNFGRILAAAGALQTGALMGVFEKNLDITDKTELYPIACTIMSLIYVVGMIVIWFAPETHRQPLPE
jgi:MFS family permease